MNNKHEWRYGWRFLNGAGGTNPADKEREHYSALPVPGVKWSDWTCHSSPAEPDDNDCGPGRLHVMIKPDARYAPTGWWIWYARWFPKHEVGRSREKAGVSQYQLRRVRPVVFWRMIRLGWCRGANLYDANLTGANLTGANLSGANLTGANLRGANLSYADLRDANLTEANLTEADLRGADLRGADLSDADLSGADLSGANLSYADLSGANLSYADLRDANLTEANLTEANLTEADLRGADLRGANLTEADLRGANLKNVIGYENTTRQHR